MAETETAEYPTGSRWMDQDGRVWTVVDHPTIGTPYFELERQAPELWHTIDHVATTYGPLKRVPKSRR